MKSVFISCVAILLSCPPLFDKNSISFKILGVQPNSEIEITGGGKDKTGKFGIGGGLEYSRRLTNRIALGAEFDWLNRSESESMSLFPGGFTTVSNDTKALLMVTRIIIFPSERFEPYVAGGLGFGVTSMKMKVVPMAGLAWSATRTTDARTVIDSSESAIAWALRLGFEAGITESVFLGGEVGLFGTGEATHNATASGREVLGNFNLKGSQSDVLFGLNLIYRFGQ